MNYVPCLVSLLAFLAYTGSAEAQSEYQKEILHLRESLYGPYSDVVDASTHAPELDETTKHKLTGELFLRDPYWRLEQQLTEDLNAIDTLGRSDSTPAEVTGKYSDILSLVHSIGKSYIPVTMEKAEEEVFQLRICILHRDVKKVAKLLNTWKQQDRGSRNK